MTPFLHLACLTTLLTAAASPPAVPVDGEPFAAELTGIDAAWQLTFGVDGKPHNLPAADLVSWGSCAEPARGPILVFADGGLLLADVFRADGETLTADSELFGVVSQSLQSRIVLDLSITHWDFVLIRSSSTDAGSSFGSCGISRPSNARLRIA